MKLLFLNLYSGRIQRGAEVFTHQLISRLKPNHQVTLKKGNSTLQPTSQFSNHPLQSLAKRLFLDKPARQVLLFSLQQIPHILKTNYDVIFPLNGFWQLLILKLIQPIKGYRIYVTGHSGPGWDERWNLWLCPDVFVATTKPTLKWAKKISPWTKSILIPLGIDSSKFKVKPTHLNLQHPIILCPSALVPYKRIDLAIQAVAKLSKGSLLVLGKGPLKQKLETLGKNALGDRFKLTSAPASKMPTYYQAADLITLPSHPQENSPMVFLESLAAAKPIVATDTPRNRWMLEQAAIYTDPTDSQTYAKALSQAQKIKKSATAHALSKFSWDNVISKYQKIINHEI